MRENYRKLRVAVLGGGTVGAQVAHRLLENADELGSRSGAGLELIGVAVRDLSAKRSVSLPKELLTTDPHSLIVGADIVVELMGGLEPARTLILEALTSGADVITANKALLAEHGPELFDAAAKVGAQLYYEAAVAAAIPIIRPLRDSLAGDHVTKIMGIVNGTTNYILTKVSQEGADYADALADAQALGYAEADPTADVEGYDAGAKAAIIASIVFGVDVRSSDVQHEGISSITAADIDTAKRPGYVIKALAVIERADGEVAVRVHPAMVPTGHPLANVNDSFNAVFVEGATVGDLMFYGRGAGGGPTASAVLGDLVDAAVNVANGAAARLSITEKATLRSVGELSSQYYLTMVVSDEPGVLAQVATVFGTHGVSIQVMEQSGTGGDAELCLILHETTEAALHATLDELDGLNVVRGIGSVIRLVSDD